MVCGQIGGLVVRTLNLQFPSITLLSYFWDCSSSLVGILSWDIITTQENLTLHPCMVAVSSTSYIWGKGGKVKHCVIPYGVWFPVAVRWFPQTAISALLTLQRICGSIGDWNSKVYPITGWRHYGLAILWENYRFFCQCILCCICLGNRYFVEKYQRMFLKTSWYHFSKTVGQYGIYAWWWILWRSSVVASASSHLLISHVWKLQWNRYEVLTCGPVMCAGSCIIMFVVYHHYVF